MANTFEKLKNNRKNDLAKLNQALTSLQSTPQKDDSEGFWKPTVDKAGNGSAIIRFLPAPDGEDVPFVRAWSHGFQGPGGWYIEKSLTTLGENDPLAEYNMQLWNTGIEANKEQVRKQKRHLHYYANIYVVKDPGNPSNEGKVFLFKFGKKIFDKLNDLMNPDLDDEVAVNPFDLWEGANFRLKIRDVEGYRNYDKSSFDSPSPLSEDDSELESIWKQTSSLQTFVDPKNFKSYDELRKRLNKVLNLDGASRPVSKNVADLEEEEFTPTKSKAAPSEASVDDDDDETMRFFKELADS